MSLRLSSAAARVRHRALPAAWTNQKAHPVLVILSGFSTTAPAKAKKQMRPRSAPPPESKRPRAGPIQVPSQPHFLEISIRSEKEFVAAIDAAAAATSRTEDKKLSADRSAITNAYHIYREFLKAAQKACDTHSNTWEVDFMREHTVTSQDIISAYYLARAIRFATPTPSQKELYLSYLLLDCAGAHGHESSTLALCMRMLIHPGYAFWAKIFPRADRRIREMARQESSADAVGVMGLVCKSEGNDQKALVMLQRALQLKAQQREAAGQDEDTLSTDVLEPIFARHVGSILHGQGKDDEALRVLRAAAEYDTPEICFETAQVLGFDVPEAQALLNRAAASGHLEAQKIVASNEMRAHTAAQEKGDTAAAKGHMANALEWNRLIDAWKVKDRQESVQYF